MKLPTWLAALVGFGVAVVVAVLAAMRRKPAPLPEPDAELSSALDDAEQRDVANQTADIEANRAEQQAIADMEPDEQLQALADRANRSGWDRS